MKRLGPRPGQVVDRSRTLRFGFAGRPVAAFAGDTIASALAASGRTVFSRSFKYHRPRGLLCVSGHCPNCLVNVDGVPNVRACTEPVRDGAEVLPQNCWPSLDRDALAGVQAIDFLLPVGFYYKLFARPRGAWGRVEPLIRRLAGLGRIGENAPEPHFEHVSRHCDVAVAGGGPAGMSAALAAARAGAEVLLIDAEPALGGHLRYHGRLPGSPGLPVGGAPEAASRLADQVAAEPRLEVLSDALVFGAYEGGLLGVRRGATLVHVRSRALVVATGRVEIPGSFEGNDLPGVLLGAGARRLIALYGVQPGTRAVVCAADDEGIALALDLADAGVAIAAVLDRRSAGSGLWSEAARQAGLNVVAGHRIVAAEGRDRVSAAVAARFDEGPNEQSGSRRRFACDLIVLAAERAPALELLRQRSVPCRYDPALGHMVPAGDVPGIWSAGRLGGFSDLDLDLAQGELAGLGAAGRDANDPRVAELAAFVRGREVELRAALGGRGPTQLPDAPHQFVCLCEDVGQKDITRAVAEGFDEIETLKRYSTVSMGPCQGRMCLPTAAALCLTRSSRQLPEPGVTTARPPVAPISLGLLAGPHHEPVKVTPLDARHRAAGAAMMDMGPWKRPRAYGDVEAEWRAVRERVGIIDVGTLGKLEVAGRDAGRLLDRVYTHVFSELPVGRSRYGLVCNDEGVILDDGTVSRFGPERFFLTTTTGNTDFMDQWLGWWLAGAGLCAHVTNVTGDYAAVNVAGPRARDTLAKLADTNLAPESFKYMACREVSVAGVPARLLRIGFVGEAGWEIHYPAAYGAYLWDAILEAGAEFGIAPFGVEAQRILRLEKGHPIIGQDTDALSTPFETELAWCIRDEKTDFIGKSGLAFQRARPSGPRLVGFVTETPDIPEGSTVVAGGRPAGRVTSCRRSPHTGSWIGMAVVPAELSTEGATLQIRFGGASVPARVVHAAFYDPEGGRVRS